MTRDIASTADAPQPSLSMFDVYNGYVVTQGHNALHHVVMWERIMRAIAYAALAAVGALWLATDAATPQVIPMKIVLSLVLCGMAGLLMWAARTRAQYETQVDLIRCELRQVMRAPSGLEQLMLRVPFDMVSGIHVQPNRDLPGASCLYMDLDGIAMPLLLGVGDVAALSLVHRRLSGDLATARNLPPVQRPRPASVLHNASIQAA